MLKCREVVDLVGTGEWRTAPLGRRLGLALHIAMCRHCRRYTLSLRRIGNAVRRLYRSEAADPEHADRLASAVRDAAERSRSD
jgi:anti-sigma factor RsiW